MKEIIFVLVLLKILLLVKADDIRSFEHQLHDHLFKDANYNRFQRPVKNSSKAVEIKFGIALIKLQNVDERQQHMTSLLWMRLLWRDEYLTWEPSQFGGLTSIRLPSSDVWKPDITLYNGVGNQEMSEVPVVVYNSGDVLFIPAGSVTSMCEMDLSKFPFDEQTCVLKYGSWVYHGDQVNFDWYEGQDKIDLSDYIGSNEWDVTSTGGRISLKYYPCCSESYPDARFNITLRRRTLYYHYLFATPAAMLGLLTPVLFLLPSDDTGKFPFGGTLLVSIAVFYNLIQGQLPMGHNTVPVIGTYYTIVFVLICLSLAISAVTNNLANRATRLSQPPAFLKTILLSCLGRLLCVPYDRGYGVGTSSVALDEGDGDKPGDKSERGPAEWRLMAMVLDRIFFLGFFTVIIITSLVLLT